MPINKGLGGFCFLKSVKDEIIAYFFCFANMNVIAYFQEIANF